MSRFAVTYANVVSPERKVRFEPERMCGIVDGQGGSISEEFATELGSLIQLAGAAQADQWPHQSRLLLLGLVSLVERTLKQVIAGLVRICPISQTVAGSESVDFSAISYYDLESLPHALMERDSLTSARNVRATLKRLTGLGIPESDSLAQALAEYTQMCQLRHAVVHSHGVLGANSVRVLRLQADSGSPLAVRFDAEGFQILAGVADNVVRAFVRFLFPRVVDRWAEGGLLDGEWANDEQRFSRLVELLAALGEVQITCARSLHEVCCAEIQRVAREAAFARGETPT